MRVLLPCMVLVSSAALVLGPAWAANPCPDQPVHTYGFIVSNGNDRDVVSEVTWVTSYPSGTSTGGQQQVHVADSNFTPCNFLSPPGLWDGDYDTGDHGAFFGYGVWAEEPSCDYQLNVHGPNVAVTDVMWGGNVPFLVGEDDMYGPIMIVDPVRGGVVCETDGTINPCTPWAVLIACDLDDCLSDTDPSFPGWQPFIGVGHTCGWGGGDGGYWVVLLEVYVVDYGGGSWACGPCHTVGTITAF